MSHSPALQDQAKDLLALRLHPAPVPSSALHQMGCLNARCHLRRACLQCVALQGRLQAAHMTHVTQGHNNTRLAHLARMDLAAHPLTRGTQGRSNTLLDHQDRDTIPGARLLGILRLVLDRVCLPVLFTTHGTPGRHMSTTHHQGQGDQDRCLRSRGGCNTAEMQKRAGLQVYLIILSVTLLFSELVELLHIEMRFVYLFIL